ncbi:MAG: phosphoribosylformylglycinamidine cyclo-ligase [Spirochaetae bacterium HGW-Spirochaetae-8]|nr:MAG: phosphoribosylformylglycinamidine cyclo-ligase [Spirochaetae bacterium HGW-Spirochaetae-8]
MGKSKTPVDYASAGVDISAGNLAVEKIKGYAASTFNANVLAGLGSFASFYDLGPILREYRHPVLVQSTDGVGTKIAVVAMAKDFSTIGRDLLSACANDIVVHGAKPLTFLDYIANDRLDPDIVAEIVKGMAAGCREEGICLVGGETAEMPGTYLPGEHDLVGLITGVVERDKIIDGSTVAVGDIILGVASSGLHTNGYSLARKVLFEIGGLSLDTSIPNEPGTTLRTALCEPHANYTSGVLKLLEQGAPIKSMAHITGGGLLENVPRVLPKEMSACFDPASWPRQGIFTLIQELGLVSEHEMYRTFNMGIGLTIVVAPEAAEETLRLMKTCFSLPVRRIGKVVAGDGATLIRGLNTVENDAR